MHVCTDRCNNGFRCKSSKHCVAKELQCNGLPNCGHGDISDETQCKLMLTFMLSLKKFQLQSGEKIGRGWAYIKNKLIANITG